MTIGYHPAFAGDIRRLTDQYSRISLKLGERLRDEIDEAIDQVKSGPGKAGHFINTGSKIVKGV
jgi:hypothetical protein